jgi:hypothetical protein
MDSRILICECVAYCPTGFAQRNSQLAAGGNPPEALHLRHAQKEATGRGGLLPTLKRQPAHPLNHAGMGSASLMFDSWPLPAEMQAIRRQQAMGTQSSKKIQGEGDPVCLALVLLQERRPRLPGSCSSLDSSWR